jgi:uncharacterized transporter YbjL
MQKFMSIFIIILPGIIGTILRLRQFREIPAWLLSCTIIPVFILISEFILPYQGGGASMWPIALAFGSFYGAMTGGLGVVLASYYLKRKKAQADKP